MRSYLADSWFFIALLDFADNHHRQARRLQEFVRGAHVVTHSAVFIEVLAFFADSGAGTREKAVQMIRRTALDADLVEVGGDLLWRGLDLYAARPDKEYSLTDCISMVVMRERGITHVLTNDHHFRQEGFTVLSDAS